jgi:hypothetical protein
MAEGQLITLAEGPCYMSVCAPKEWTKEDVEDHVWPSGTRRGWKVSEDTHFFTGQTNPCPCDLDDTRTHWLMDC